MITKTMMVRMKYRTFKQMKFYFPAKRGESAADYFERMLEDVIIKNFEDNE
jgi:hypothetical protein